MSEGPEYPVEGVRNALALLENAYWILQRENERKKAEIDLLQEDRDRWRRLARRLYDLMGEQAEALLPGELEVLGPEMGYD